MPQFPQLKDSQNVKGPSEDLPGAIFSTPPPTAQTALTPAEQMENKWERPQDSQRWGSAFSFWVDLTFHGFNSKVIRPETRGSSPLERDLFCFYHLSNIAPIFLYMFPRIFS